MFFTRSCLSFVAITPLLLLACASSEGDIDGADGSGSRSGAGGKADGLSSDGTASSGGSDKSDSSDGDDAASGGGDSPGGNSSSGGKAEGGGPTSGGLSDNDYSTGGTNMGGEGGMGSAAGGSGENGGSDNESSGGADSSGGAATGGSSDPGVADYQQCDWHGDGEENPECDEGSVCRPNNYCSSVCEVDPDSVLGLTGPGDDCPRTLTGEPNFICEAGSCKLRCDNGDCPDGMLCAKPGYNYCYRP